MCCSIQSSIQAKWKWHTVCSFQKCQSRWNAAILPPSKIWHSSLPCFVLQIKGLLITRSNGNYTDLRSWKSIILRLNTFQIFTIQNTPNIFTYKWYCWSYPTMHLVMSSGSIVIHSETTVYFFVLSRFWWKFCSWLEGLVQTFPILSFCRSASNFLGIRFKLLKVLPR